MKAINTKENSDLVLVEYQITDAPRHLFPVGSPQYREAEKYHDKIRIPNPPASLMTNLEESVRKFPEVPVLRNYLAVMYGFRKPAKLEAFLIDTIRLFPNYVFGYANLIDYFTQKTIESNFQNLTFIDTLESILGNEIKPIEVQFAPRKEFHITEVTGYTSAYVFYLVCKGNVMVAKSYLPLLKKLDVSKAKIQRLQSIIKMRNLVDNMTKLMQIDKGIDGTLKQFFKPSSIAPVFTHQEVAELYKYDYEIDQKLIQKILALPRATLIADLETILKDAQIRYDYYAGGKAPHENSYYVVEHTLALLGELKATESLQAVLNIFRQNNEFTDYWFGDDVQDVAQLIYKISHNQLDALRDYLFEKNNYLFARTTIAEAVSKIIYFHPERRAEVVAWYKEVFAYFIEHKEDKTILDITLIASMISDALDIPLHELHELFEKLYENNMVSIRYIGEYTAVCEELAKNRPRKIEVELSIAEFYDRKSQGKILFEYIKYDDEKLPDWENAENPFDGLLNSGEFDDFEEDEYLPFNKPLQPTFHQASPFDKIGRNDKITVKYKDGTVQADVKFKKVEDDLKSGKCELVK
jgi:hypothetical protein